ncbi:MAG: tetratricopeptide repeat protein, partial [Pseudomonadota bacterium]|nr:tetratricopeptide repeat protein [Pseudomonadota bacterium]
MRKGAQYVANSEWDKASVEARNVLQMDAKNAGAYLIAAEVEDGKGSFRNAFGNYGKVLELDPTSVPGRLGLARIYLLSGDMEKPQPLIDSVLASEPQNARAQTLQVALFARQGMQAEALAGADRVVKGGLPLGAESGLMLAGFYFNVHALEPALAVLDRSIAASPQDARLPQM